MDRDEPLQAEELSRALRVLGLLAAEAGGLFLLLPALTGSRWIVRFVAHNQLEPATRGQLLAQVALGSSVTLLVAAIALAVSWRRRGSAGVREKLDFLSRVTRLLAPALVLWAVPQLMVWRAWAGRELLLLVSAACVLLILEPVLVTAFAAGRELRLPTAVSTWVARAKSLREPGGGHAGHRIRS